MQTSQKEMILETEKSTILLFVPIFEIKRSKSEKIDMYYVVHIVLNVAQGYLS